jgi:hypothetical protein
MILRAALTLVFAMALLPALGDETSFALAVLHQIPAGQGNWMEDAIKTKKSPPAVILTARGALITGSKDPVPFDHVLVALAKLPLTAWPYGRIIIYSPSPVGLSTDRAPSPADVKKVEDAFKAAGIKLDQTMVSV